MGDRASLPNGETGDRPSKGQSLEQLLMYRPVAFQEDNVDQLVSFMRANSFATLVSIVDSVPFASHLPLVVTVQENVVTLTVNSDF